MLPAIDFNDQLSLAAGEVDNERTDRFLTYELEPAQPPIAHGEPDFALGVGLRAAQLAFDADGFAIWTTHDDLPLTRLAFARHPLPVSRGEGKRRTISAAANHP